MKKIAIFASGSGSNAIKIIEHLHKNGLGEVAYIVSNNPKAGIHAKAHALDIPVISIEKEFKTNPSALIQTFQKDNIELIVLAGFLWKIPNTLIQAFPRQIVNIHPSLLPQYGGKGMYGMHIHKAVIGNKETVSGLTIHYVNEEFDEGEHIIQVHCPVSPEDSPESLAKKILKLEHTYYPIAVASILSM